MAAKKFECVSAQYYQANAVASGNKTAGTPYAVATRVVGFPIIDVTSGDAYAAVYACESCRALKSVASEVIPVGSLLYWNNSAGGVTAVAGGLTCTLGFSTEASANGDTTVLMNFYGLNQVLA